MREKFEFEVSSMCVATFQLVPHAIFISERLDVSWSKHSRRFLWSRWMPGDSIQQVNRCVESPVGVITRHSFLLRDSRATTRISTLTALWVFVRARSASLTLSWSNSERNARSLRSSISAISAISRKSRGHEAFARIEALHPVDSYIDPYGKKCSLKCHSWAQEIDLEASIEQNRNSSGRSNLKNYRSREGVLCGVCLFFFSLCAACLLESDKAFL